jgi:uncharacterized protein (UPF0297 family)
MPEETLTPVDQGEAAEKGYFETHELVEQDDVEDPDSPIEKDDQDKDTPKEGEKKGGDEKQGEDEKGGDKDKLPVSLQSLKEIPKDFSGSFFSKGEDGKISFNREDALGFLLPKDGKPRFNYQADRRKVVESKDDTTQPKTPEDIKKERREQIKEHRTSVREKALNPIKKVIEYANSGNYQSMDEVLRAVEKDVLLGVQDELEDYDIKGKQDYEDQLEERFGSKTNFDNLKKEAESNERLMINDFAEKFNITDASEAYKKYSEFMKHGTPIINQLFDMMNPKFLEGHTQKQINEGMNRWWTEIASNKNTLNFVYERIMDNFNTSMAPYLFENIQSGKDKLNKDNKRASKRSPSNVNRDTPKSAKGVDETLRYFNSGVTEI